MEYQNSKDIEKDIYSFFDKNKENKKNIEKNFYTILIIGTEESNQKFINGFLNFLFGVNEDDKYRLVLESNYGETENIFSSKIINSEKGNFVFFCINIGKKNKLHLKSMIESFKDIEKEVINLIVFNMYEASSEPEIQLNDSEKYDMFFVCPSISFDILKYKVLEKEFKIIEKIKLIKNDKADEKIIKEIIIEMIKHDELVRQKYISCYLNYDCIYDNTINKDIFFKYSITMEGYQYFYNVITTRKNKYIDFSSLIKFLLKIEEKEKEKQKLRESLNEKKGEDWTEYHLYDIKIKNLEKDKTETEKEINDLKKQKEENYNDLNNEIKMIDDKIDFLRYYKVNIEKDASMLLPVFPELGNKLRERTPTNVCQKCKCNCHIDCDETVKKFCKCYKFTLKGFKCTVCPNECFSNFHEVVNYQYPKYEYKKIDDILKMYYKDEYPRRKSAKSKLDYLIDLKEEEKEKVTENYKKKNNTLDIVIDDKKNIIKGYLETIEMVKDKRDKIYDNHKNKIDAEIIKIDLYIEHGDENLKPYEKLFIESLKEVKTSSSLLGDVKCNCR